MLRFGAIFRLLALAACLVPFTNVQQAAGALAPLLPIVPSPVSDAPSAPANEEEDEREREGQEELTGKEQHAPHTRHPLLVRELVGTLPPARRAHAAKPRTTPPSAADPFRNGLGTPYRC